MEINRRRRIQREIVRRLLPQRRRFNYSSLDKSSSFYNILVIPLQPTRLLHFLCIRKLITQLCETRIYRQPEICTRRDFQHRDLSSEQVRELIAPTFTSN